MSTFTVEIVKILEVVKHPNADKLDLVKVKGWQVVAQSGQYAAGDSTFYCPIDAVLPQWLSDKMDVTKYLSRQRVRTARLRGEYSQGLLIPLGMIPLGKVRLPIGVGDNYAEEFGITKYDPPVPINMSGLVAPHNPDFPKYTDIENIKNFPDVLQEGEEVVITEKIHGTNFRVGVVGGELMVGSHNWPLKETEGNLYWRVVREHPEIEVALRTYWADTGKNIILFGEVYGKGIQKVLDYGASKPEVRFFDIMTEGTYRDTEYLKLWLNLNKLKAVPHLFSGPWSWSELKYLADGESMLAKHIKEGFVVRPKYEKDEYKLGRVILKHISEAYLMKDYGDLH